MKLLEGKKGLIVGIANAQSIAAGCANIMHDAGAELALTYLNDKAKPYVEPIAKSLKAPLFLPLDVEQDDQFDTLFEAIDQKWGKLDFLLHSIAYCPIKDLHSPLSECSRAGFLQAMNISVYSFIKMARLAAPLMKDGGSLLTVSYYGSEKVIDHYNVMGPVKAALESSVRYLAAELGPKGIRVNAISPGPLVTRAASGIDHFDELIDKARKNAPERQLVTIEDVGAMAMGLASDLSRNVTGNISYVDGGLHIMG